MNRGEIAWSAVYETVDQLIDTFGLAEPPVDPRGLAKRMGIPVLRFSDIDLGLLEPALRIRLERFYGAFLPNPAGGGTIYVREGLSAFKDKDTVSHELGHATIRHHREVLLMGWSALAPELRQILEDEARVFSIVLRLLGGRFDAEAAEFVYGMETAKFLADRYALSYEMALRRYVTIGPPGPILRVFDIHRNWESMDSLALKLYYRYFVKPSGGSKLWIPEEPGTSLPLDHPLCAVLPELRRAEVLVGVPDTLGRGRCTHEILSTQQRLYVLSKPLGWGD